MTISQSQTPPTNGNVLKPWREVMRPNQDVVDGSFLEVEFAASLQAVYDGSAVVEYGNPWEFFHRTYPTAGIRNLLATAVRRISGNGGNPVIQTKTGFGGGKTHSLIALYHLINHNQELLKLPEAGHYSRVRNDIRKIMADAGANSDVGFAAKVAVLSGDWLSPDSNRTTEAGDPLNTLWGEMAWQLGGQEAYETIGSAARNGNAPGGEELNSMFRMIGPCVILMDEVVNYARNADLDRIATFLQNLTTVVQRQSNAILVASLPVSSDEAGGNQGMRALDTLGTILERVDSVLRVAETGNDEAFAVVRRRLFQDECDEAARDVTCQAFQRMYQQRTAADYPPKTREARYLERLRQCYPIHPEIFDRLYEDWSSYHQFQRTRGVLRLMAQTISRLCADGAMSPLIMPGDLPFSNSKVSNVFISLLGPQWDAVMAEVDQEHSRTHQIDLKKPERYGRVGGAARRIARAVFLGSATEKAVRGITIQQVNLGVAMPNHGTATYRDAMHEMDGHLYHFYRGVDGRYYFDAQENLNKVANDRMLAIDSHSADQEIINRLREFRSNNETRAVIVCPNSPADVPDTDHVRLVILAPQYARETQAASVNPAAQAAHELLTKTGTDTYRQHVNSLVFLVANASRVSELRTIAKRYLAWDSILNGDQRLTLTGERRLETRQRITEEHLGLDNAIATAYTWIMAPSQLDSMSDTYDVSQWHHVAGQGDIAVNAFQQLQRDEALADALVPTVLDHRLHRYVWSGTNPSNHLSFNDLWNLLTTKPYFQIRLRNRHVLEKCISDGVSNGNFGVADSYDTGVGKYENLRFNIPAVAVTNQTLIVSKDVALKALAKVQATNDSASQPSDNQAASISSEDSTTATVFTSTPSRPKRVTVSKSISQNASLYDLNEIRDEIARNLSNDGGDVTIEVIISAYKESGFSPQATSAVVENSEQLALDLNQEGFI